MEREWGNGERFILYISSISLYFLPLYPFPISKASKLQAIQKMQIIQVIRVTEVLIIKVRHNTNNASDTFKASTSGIRFQSFFYRRYPPFFLQFRSSLFGRLNRSGQVLYLDLPDLAHRSCQQNKARRDWFLYNDTKVIQLRKGAKELGAISKPWDFIVRPKN